MAISNVNELADLDAMIAGGYITRRKHPTADLYIYNYTARAQYEPMWNEATMTCRGLITDGEGKIVARPFTKFFNLEQMESLPDEPFEVYEKLDGSLGIMYWLDGKPYIATRGSFDSPQAIESNRLLLLYVTERLDQSITYLFEIIYPENRIVVDYGDYRGLTMIAAIRTDDGLEIPLYKPKGEKTFQDFHTAKLHVFQDIHDLRMFTACNFEGFVVRFQSGLRVKVKLSEYVRLHRLLTGISEKRILEDYLMPGSLDALYESVPDEFKDWVNETVAKFQAQYAEIERAARLVFDSVAPGSPRRDCAVVFTKSEYASILFAMLDGKDYAKMIWRMVKVEGETFRKDGNL